jgi:hypothetical protein
VTNDHENQSQNLVRIEQILKKHDLGTSNALDAATKATLKRLSYGDDIDLARKAIYLRRLFPQAAGVSADEVPLLEKLYDQSHNDAIKASALRILCMYLPDAPRQTSRVLDGLRFRQEDIGDDLALTSCTCAGEILKIDRNDALISALIGIIDSQEHFSGTKAGARDAIIIGLRIASSHDVFRMSMIEDREDELWEMARKAIATL